jgi:ribosomal protein S18 acetylase RimI-like enzyme
MSAQSGGANRTETKVGEINIRPYEARDRQSVRRVCYETGFMGDPVDWMWRDRESFGDIFTGYWTDREPENARVAELDGEVVGYLLGCTDSRKVWNVGKLVARHALRRGLLLRPGTAGVFRRMFTDGISDAIHKNLPPPTYYDERWPAHLHIDLLPVCRGRNVGATLVGGWLQTLKSHGIPGCHLQTMAQNSKAMAFFERMGFEKLGRPKGAPGFRTKSGERMSVQLMVQPFEPQAG